MGLRDLDRLLDEESQDMWAWLTGQTQPPPHVADNTVYRDVRAKVARAMENGLGARAGAGVKWRSGWDDLKAPPPPAPAN